MVAIVASRILDNVLKDPPEVDIYLPSYTDLDLDPQQEWIMVEARAGYYEASRHTMTALQKLYTER
jgi:helicase required for RNAi-mediated heterochromatin assembly 1